MNLAAMFERIAANPDVNVEKLQALMDMQRTILQDQAKVAFNEAMAAAQAEMRPVVKDADNPQTRSRYASYEAIDRALRPIYSKHGFALSFNTDESKLAEHVCVVCLVSHRAGYERVYRVDMPADGKGAKGGDVMTKTHAAGSAMQYGMRYLLKLIFNVATSDKEDDGNAASRKVEKPKPAGYDAWVKKLEQAASKNKAALLAEWKDGRADHRDYMNFYNLDVIEDLRAKAEESR